MRKVIVVCLFTLVLIFNHISVGFALAHEDDLDPTSFKVKILPWEQVNSFIPKKSQFTIIDVETGLSFDVQRRAGSSHADVQPLTHKDTKVMKTIYNGKWSWNRRAILVLTNDRMIAASMHGMPHGAGALHNGFPGHFCVHFFGSTTHGLKNEDFAHKIMILKAGGKLEDFISEIGPMEMVRVLEVAINQRDKKLINMVVSQKEKQNFMKNFNNIQFIKFDPNSISTDVENKMVVYEQVPATFYTRDNHMEKKFFEFVLWKDFGTGQWYFDQHVKISN